MGSNHALRNSETAPKVQSESVRRNDSPLENEMENRIENLDKLFDSINAALDQESFSDKPHALDLVNDLRVKMKAIHNMFRVAKLLSEPARESMISRVRHSLNDLEEVVASHLGVELT
jgi:hypothetical protein